MIVRQVMLARHPHDPPAFEHGIDIVELAALDHRQPDPERRPLRAGGREPVEFGAGMGHQRGLHHQILRLVADEEHLRQRHQIRPGGAALAVGGDGLGGVSGQIAHRRIELRHRQAKRVAHALISPIFPASRIQGARPH